MLLIYTSGASMPINSIASTASYATSTEYLKPFILAKMSILLVSRSNASFNLPSLTEEIDVTLNPSGPVCTAAGTIGFDSDLSIGTSLIASIYVFPTSSERCWGYMEIVII